MKIGPVFRKSLKENLRDWKILILTLTFAPFFVFLMYLFCGQSSQNLKILVCNQDEQVVLRDGTVFNAGRDLVDRIGEYQSRDEGKFLQLVEDNDLDAAKRQLQNADLLVLIPGDFSKMIDQYRSQSGTGSIGLTFYGSTPTPKYMIAASVIYNLTSDFVRSSAKISPPLSFREEWLAKSRPRSDFDYYVPSLLILSVIMILFTAGASIIKENDRGTMIRLKISGLGAAEFLTGIGLVQVIITFIALMLTYLTALCLGFQPAGSLVDVLIIGFVSSLSLMAISLIVASWLNTIFDLMTVGCFPFFLLMFFSGGMFPMPQVKLFSLGGQAFNITDLLPTSHAIVALDKIINYGMGLGDVLFQITAILALTALYFILGLWMFKKRHMTITG